MEGGEGEFRLSHWEVIGVDTVLVTLAVEETTGMVVIVDVLGKAGILSLSADDILEEDAIERKNHTGE